MSDLLREFGHEPDEREVPRTIGGDGRRGLGGRFLREGPTVETELPLTQLPPVIDRTRQALGQLEPLF